MGSVQERQRQKIERFIEKMPALSTTVCKVMDVCSRTDASPNELHKVISLDPVLAAQVLKLANSAYYSFVEEVTSLVRAITRLGTNTVKNMALSMAIVGTINKVKKNEALPITPFWRHSIAAGVSAKILGREIGGLSRLELDELFIAGLTHDLGKIPFGVEYIRPLRFAEREQIPLIVAERELLGMDHQEIGLLISEKWRLNSRIRNCINHHHDINSLHTLEDQARLVAIVALGNIFANIYSFGFAGNMFPEEEDVDRLLDFLKCDYGVFKGLGLQVEEEIRLAATFLQV